MEIEAMIKQLINVKWHNGEYIFEWDCNTGMQYFDWQRRNRCHELDHLIIVYLERLYRRFLHNPTKTINVNGKSLQKFNTPFILP